MKRDKFDIWYKDQLDGLGQEPPEKVWENISNHLDTEKVWDNINSSLDRKERRKKRIVVLFALLMLIGAASLITTQFWSVPETPILVDHQENYVDGPNDEITALDKGTDPNENNIHSVDESTTQNNIIADDSIVAPDVRDRGEFVAPVKPSVDHVSSLNNGSDPQNNSVAVLRVFPNFPSIPGKFQSFHSGSERELSLVDQIVCPDTVAHQRPSYFVAGASAIGSFSGLINNQSINSLKKNTTSSVGFLPDVSGQVYTEFIVHGKSGIGGFAWWSSSVHQVYRIYHEGEVMSNELNLGIFKAGIYTSWYFDYKKNRAFGPENCLIAGITGNFITRKSYSGSEGEYYNPKNLHEFYPGIILGFKKYQPLFPGLYLHAGMNLEGSITNVFTGESGVPKDFFRTHVVSASVALGLSYRVSCSER